MPTTRNVSNEDSHSMRSNKLVVNGKRGEVRGSEKCVRGYVAMPQLLQRTLEDMWGDFSPHFGEAKMRQVRRRICRTARKYLRGKSMDRNGATDKGLGPRLVPQQRLDGEVLPLKPPPRVCILSAFAGPAPRRVRRARTLIHSDVASDTVVNTVSRQSVGCQTAPRPRMINAKS